MAGGPRDWVGVEVTSWGRKLAFRCGFVVVKGAFIALAVW
jgi:hypothetical protein